MATESSGYSGTPLPKKLGIREGSRVALCPRPDGFEAVLGPLPCGARLRANARGRCDVVVFFVTRRAELARRFPIVRPRARHRRRALGGVAASRRRGWRPTSTSTRVQEVGLDAGLVDNKVCAIDATWSGLRFVRRVADRSA